MDYYQKYLRQSPEKTIRQYRTKGDSYWNRVSEKMALDLFHQASIRVPAYQKFLKKHKIDPVKIKSISDFNNVPVMDKENYINKYKVNELCWDGKIESSHFVSASSGSTGVPNFWPRSCEQTYQGATIAEFIYREFFQVDRKSTLYIDAFAMGMWIAGTYMMMSTQLVADKGYPITIATPGLNREEILRLVKFGDQYYDQIILVGYPPFIKDVVDFGINAGINWKSINIKFLFSGEAFTERWREHLCRTTNIKNQFTDTINIYGSADIGLVAHETPLTNSIRNLASKNKSIRVKLFGSDRIPSVHQYNPNFRYFEKVQKELIATAPSGLPLIRYNTKDRGDTIRFDVLEKTMKDCGNDITKLMSKNNVGKHLWKLPIVYLFGRDKFATSIFGVTIYPEYIKYILDNKSLSKILTGKYIITTIDTKKLDQELVLRVEFRDGIKASNKISKEILEVFLRELPALSGEYKHLLSIMGPKVYPTIIVHTYGDDEYFPRGIVRKNA